MSPRLLRYVAAGSILLSMTVLVLKYVAYKLTGSAALYSDAIESIVNVVAGVMAFIAVHYSTQPPDAKHPYGHEKIEYVSAVIEGLFVVAAALLIFYKAWEAWAQPEPIEYSYVAILVSVLASILNVVWAWILLVVSKKALSPALEADGKHLLSDVVSSVGVLVGFGLVWWTQWNWLDMLVAAGVGVHILWAGGRLVERSIAGLMDAAAPDEDLCRIVHLIQHSAKGALQAHAIKSRWAGKTLFVEFHLVVPGAMTVYDAHAICDRIEESVQHEFVGSQVIIHVEPDEKQEIEDAVLIVRHDA